MNEKKAIGLFIVGCLLVLLGLLLKETGILSDYTVVFVGIFIESLSIALFAYSKIKKN